MSDRQSNQHKNTYQSSEGNSDLDQLNANLSHRILQIKQGLVQHTLGLDDQHKINLQIKQIVKNVHAGKVRLASSQRAKFLQHVIYRLMKLHAFERLAVEKASCKKQLQQAVLSDHQRAQSSAKLKSLDQQAQRHLLASRSRLSIKTILTNGLGLLRNYANECFIMSCTNLLDRLHQIGRQALHQVMRASKNTMARRIVVQKISAVETQARSDMMNTSTSDKMARFAKIRHVQQQGSRDLKLIAADHDQVLQNVTAFNDFVNQVKNVIVKSTRLKKGVRSELIKALNYYRHTVLDRFKHPYTAVADYVLDAKRQQLPYKLLILNSRLDGQLIDEQLLDSDSRQALSNFVKTSRIVQRRFSNGKFGLNIPDSFAKALDRIDRAFRASCALIYRQQVERGVSGVCLRINDYIDLPSEVQKRLIRRVKVRGRYLEQHPFKVRPVFIQQRLTAFFDRQYKANLDGNVSNQITSLQTQIRNARLSLDQRQQLLERIMMIQKSSTVNGIKQLKLRHAASQALTQDRQSGLIQLLRLNDRIQKKFPDVKMTQTERQKLGRVVSRIAATDSLPQTDHEVQQGENLFYQKLFDQQKGASQSRKSIIISQSHKFHDRISLAVLSPHVRDFLNDVLDQSINKYGFQMLHKQGVAQSKSRWSDQFAHAIKQSLLRLFPRVKIMYTDQLRHLARDAKYQLMAYTSSQQVFSQLRNLQSKILAGVNHTKRFMKLETAQQTGIRKLNHFVNRVIGRMDYARLKFDRRIDQSCRAVCRHLNNDSIESAFSNRIIEAANQAYHDANYNVGRTYHNIFQDYQHQLTQLLKRNYQYRWSQHFKEAESLVKQNLQTVPASQQKCLRSLSGIDSRVVNSLKQRSAKLQSIIQDGKDQLHKVVKQSISLNPTKRSIYRKLNKVSQQVRQHIDKFSRAKARTKYLKRLDQLHKSLIKHLNHDNDDHRLSLISRENHHKLDALDSEVIRKSQLNRYEKDSSKVEKRLQNFKLLDDEQSRSINGRFNRAYHKAIHEISHASKLDEYLRYEKNSENSLEQIVDRARKLSRPRSKYFDAIKAKVSSVKRQIDQLNNLQSADKHSSSHLLDEIQQRGVQMIRDAKDEKHLQLAEKNGKKMASQVLSKINSADVLVAAIQSADSRISHSSLSQNEKQKMLKRIRKTITTNFGDHSSNLESASGNTHKMNKKE